MRDQDRIDLYYRFGTTDWRSEREKEEQNTGKSFIFAPARYFRLATLLLTLALKNMAPERMKKK